MIAAALIHSPPAYDFAQMVTTARAWLKYYGATWYMCALAPGWDTAFAHAAILDGVPVSAAMPFLRPVSQWDLIDRNRHNQVIARARQSFVLSYRMENDEDRAGCDEWRIQSAELLFHVGAFRPIIGRTCVSLGAV